MHAFYVFPLVPCFEFQNIIDWLPILTADDVMETLLSSALKNWRMIRNEMQPRSFWGGRVQLGAGLSAELYVH